MDQFGTQARSPVPTFWLGDAESLPPAVVEESRSDKDVETAQSDEHQLLPTLRLPPGNATELPRADGLVDARPKRDVFV